jgi:hypothetical protein
MKLIVSMTLLVLLGCNTHNTEDQIKLAEQNDQIKQLESFFEQDGKATLEYYLNSKYRKVDLIDCYSLLTEEKKKNFSIMNAMEIQLTMENPVFHDMSKLNRFSFKELSRQDESSITYEVLVSEVDFPTFVHQCSEKYKPKFKNQTTKADTINWVMSNINSMADSTTIYPLRDSKLVYKLERKIGRYYVNPLQSAF